MLDVVYINDDISVEHCSNFENLMTEEINKHENKKNWIGGEFYIQTCIFLLLENRFKDNYKRLTLKENKELLEKNLSQSKIIILPGWTNDIEGDSILYNYKDKLYSYTYFPKKFLNMKNLTSHKFSNQSTSIYYYPIKFNNNKKNKYEFDKNIKGILMGKCISHNIRKFDNIIKILNKLNEKKIKLYSTMRNLKEMDVFPKYLEKDKEEFIIKSNFICGHKSLNVLGIINPPKFRKLLEHCKYVLCLGHPRSPPTIIEALFSDCIVIAPSVQISEDLRDNKNVYITDSLSVDEIVSLIEKIENNEILFNKNNYPVRYTEDSMEESLKSLINNICQINY